MEGRQYLVQPHVFPLPFTGRSGGDNEQLHWEEAQTMTTLRPHGLTDEYDCRTTAEWRTRTLFPFSDVSFTICVSDCCWSALTICSFSLSHR
jgi:hypothetical protein